MVVLDLETKNQVPKNYAGISTVCSPKNSQLILFGSGRPKSGQNPQQILTNLVEDGYKLFAGNIFSKYPVAPTQFKLGHDLWMVIKTLAHLNLYWDLCVETVEYSNSLGNLFCNLSV